MVTTGKRLIVVLGMHRGGTSALTRGLKVLGVELGDNLMPPFAGENETGYWEDLDIYALNVEMLGVIGSDWHSLSPIQRDCIEVLRKKGYLLRAVELLRRKTADAPVFGFKDPRVPKLLPFWREVFRQCQFEVSYVIALRHPVSVARSLKTRDKFDTGKSHLLWLQHTLASLAGTAGEKRIFIDYDRLLLSPAFELERLAKQLELQIDHAEAEIYTNKFLSGSLRNSRCDLNDLLLDDTCPPIVREIYIKQLEAAADKISAGDLSLQKNVDVWLREFERFNSLLQLADRLLAQNTSAAQAVAESNLGLSEAREELRRIYASRKWKLLVRISALISRAKTGLAALGIRGNEPHV
ncbi:MAG: hypothetical protein NTY45_12405 [Elusimicrobia bacterium]|nr:hypothetical protein [Elusimicrobiota bacterium]